MNAALRTLMAGFVASCFMAVVAFVPVSSFAAEPAKKAAGAETTTDDKSKDKEDKKKDGMKK